MRNLLVYAKPLTAVDDIISMDKTSVVGRKSILPNEEYFRGHYPDYAIYPGVFIVESVEQTARYYLSEFGYDAQLTEVRTRFLSPVRPGDVIELQLKCKEVEDGRALRVTGKCMKHDIEAASIRLVYAIGESRED